MEKKKKTRAEKEISSCPCLARPNYIVALIAIACFIFGFLIWGLVGKVEIRVNGAAEVNHCVATVYVKEAESKNIKINDTIYLQNLTFTVKSIDESAIQVDEENVPHAIKNILNLQVGEMVRRLNGDINTYNTFLPCYVVTDKVCILESIKYGFLK